MAIATLEPFSIDGRCVLHGVAAPGAVDAIGVDHAEFAGVRIRIVEAGGVSALVSDQGELGLWGGLIRRPLRLADVAPSWSALSSLLPFVPVSPGTVFENEGQVEQLLEARGIELRACVAANADYLECLVSAAYSEELAAQDPDALDEIARLRPESEFEWALVKRTLDQALTGRKATFFARLRRSLSDATVDMVPVARSAQQFGYARRVLIPRSGRLAFERYLQEIALEAGPAALLKISPFLPPVSFRRLEIESPDESMVQSARAALGLGETAERRQIRAQFHRALQRRYPMQPADRKRCRLSDLNAQFALLDGVAEGQVRAAKTECDIKFDSETLKNTWLMRVHQHDAADKAA